jgi:predicted MFS family arabinose efflux permease
MSGLRSAPGALRLLALSIIGQLPLTALSITLLLQAQHLTGSFAIGGLVTGTYAICAGAGGPPLGQLVDRCGQTLVLITSAIVCAASLLTTALLDVGTSPVVICLLAGIAGLATPPIGACTRTLFTDLLPDRVAVQAAYSVEASGSELAWVTGPPLALAVTALWSAAAAVAMCGLVLLSATIAVAAQPVSRAWRPGDRPRRRPGGALRAPTMRIVVIVLVAVGVLFGTVEVAITGAAEAMGSKTIAAPLLALWGAGSLVGGIMFVQRDSGRHRSRTLLRLLGLMAVGHAALALAAGSAYALAAVLFAAGATIAPTYGTIYTIVDGAAPVGTATEAFAWVETAIAVGGAIGAALAGVLVTVAGPAAVFAVAAAAGLIALLTATRLRTGDATDTHRSPGCLPSATADAAAVA